MQFLTGAGKLQLHFGLSVNALFNALCRLPSSSENTTLSSAKNNVVIVSHFIVPCRDDTVYENIKHSRWQWAPVSYPRDSFSCVLRIQFYPRFCVQVLDVEFEVIAAAFMNINTVFYRLSRNSMKVDVFWVIALCSLEEVCRRFRAAIALMWMEQAPLKRRQTSRRHGATTQKTAVLSLWTTPTRCCGMPIFS
jgi:hypothetical protein